MSTTTAVAPRLRPRRPLAPLPLSHFTIVPSNAFPSPISLPLKRPASSASTSTCAGPSTRASSSTAAAGGSAKMRKVSYTEEDGTETVKRTRVREAITPRARSFLEKDDLGLGRSPARRLFVDEQEGKSYGITGATTAPAPTASPGQRSLAPSPPMRSNHPTNSTGIDTPTSPILSSIPLENGLDIHDPGFTIYSDTSPRRAPFPLTPESRRPSRALSNPPHLALDASAHIPSSPGSVVSCNSQIEDQENVPPSLSHSAASTPSKSRSSLASPASPTSKRSSLSVDEDWTPGSRSRRTIERSKLGLESFIIRATETEELDDPEVHDEGEELTPGRKVVRRRQVESGRKMLMREVNRI